MINSKKSDHPFPISSIINLGKFTKELLLTIGFASRIGIESLYYWPYALKKWRGTLQQMYICGLGSLAVVLIVAAFTGMIIATQTGIELKKYGQEAFIGGVVAISICREMGPFMTGLILAATVSY